LHGGLELFGVNLARVLSVEQVESLLDFFDFVIGESGTLDLLLQHHLN
jgi:hypothetical protein